MGKSVTKAAADTRDRILGLLCLGTNSNTYALQLDEPQSLAREPKTLLKTFHFEEDNEDEALKNCLPGEVSGRVYLHDRDEAIAFSTVLIDQFGELVNGPYLWFKAAKGDVSSFNLVDPS